MAAATAADQSENLVVVVGEGQAVAATTAAQQSVWVTEVWISLAEKEREGRTSSAKNPQLLQKQQLLQLRHDHHDSRAVEKNWGGKGHFSLAIQIQSKRSSSPYWFSDATGA